MDRKVFMIWIGRSTVYGPEGQDDEDRKVIRVGPEGLPELGRKSPETHGSEDPIDLSP